MVIFTIHPIIRKFQHGFNGLSVVFSIHNTMKHATWLKLDHILSYFFQQKMKKNLIFSIKVSSNCRNMIPINQQFGFSFFSHNIALVFCD